MKANLLLLFGLSFFTLQFSHAQTDTTKQVEPLPNSNYNRGSGTNPNNYGNSGSTKNNAGNDNGQPNKKKTKKKNTPSPANTQKRRK